MWEGLVVSNVLLWSIVLGNLLLTLAVVRRLSNRGQGSVEIGGPKAGQPAPDFTAQTLKGETLSLADYAGRSVALLVVSPACRPCREALPRYEALGPIAQHAGTELVLVSAEDLEQTRRFVEEFRIQLPVIVASRHDNPFVKDYNFSGTPAYCIVDSQGIVISSGWPAFEWGEWKQHVDLWTSEWESDRFTSNGDGREVVDSRR